MSFLYILAAKQATVRKKARSRKSAGKDGNPNWLWLATGIFVGLFIAIIAYVLLSGNNEMREFTESDRKSTSGSSNSIEKAELKKGQNADGEKAASRFEFYNILPELEVLMPSPPAKGDGEKVKAGDMKVEPGEYLLQSGSFKARQDAEKRKAAMALLGVEVTIQTVKLDTGDTWHRVQSGPYKSLEILQQVRTLLRDNGIDTLMIKKRG